MLKRRQAGEDVTAVLERELKPLADAYSESIHKLEEFQQRLYDGALARAEENAAQGRLDPDRRFGAGLAAGRGIGLCA